MGARRVEHAEDGRVRADADGERRDRDGGEAGRFPKCTERVADVLLQRLDRMECPHVAALLLQIGHVAKAPPGRKARLGTARAAVAVVGFAHRQMKGQLVVQVAFEPPANERAQPREHVRRFASRG